MGTRGFVGFKRKGVIRGWYNHYDSYYDGLGLQALKKFEDNDLNTLTDFFLRGVKLVKDNEDNYYENHKKVMSLNWAVDSITLQNGSEFIYDGLFCEYAYVYNLDKDTLDVYRGFFPTQQFRGFRRHCESGGDKFYTHKVLTIHRDEIKQARDIFSHESKLNEDISGYIYWEEQFMEKFKFGMEIVL